MYGFRNFKGTGRSAHGILLHACVVRLLYSQGNLIFYLMVLQGGLDTFL